MFLNESTEQNQMITDCLFQNKKMNRIGFATFHCAKDAIKAKKILNEDPKSKFRGLIQVGVNFCLCEMVNDT